MRYSHSFVSYCHQRRYRRLRRRQMDSSWHCSSCCPWTSSQSCSKRIEKLPPRNAQVYTSYIRNLLIHKLLSGSPWLSKFQNFHILTSTTLIFNASAVTKNNLFSMTQQTSSCATKPSRIIKPSLRRGQTSWGRRR